VEKAIAWIGQQPPQDTLLTAQGARCWLQVTGRRRKQIATNVVR
jgi:hypothetical protein